MATNGMTIKMTMTTDRKALLVDGNNLFARAAFAAKGSRTQMSVDGYNTSALVIFVNLLAKYVATVKPTHMALFWDAGHTLRDEIDPRYKAKRVKHVEEDEEAITPWRQAREFLTWAGVPHLARKGFEADDLIAYVAHSEIHKPGSTVILSGDKDLLQLIDGTTTQIRPGGKGAEEWDADRVAQDMECLAENIPLLMSLTGDAGDGVQGVAGIGPKKAVKLLNEAGWEWEALLRLLGPEKAADALQARRLVDLRNREFSVWGDPLSQLSLGAPYLPEFNPTARGDMSWEPLVEFLDRWKLASIKERLLSGALWQSTESGYQARPLTEVFADFDFD